MNRLLLMLSVVFLASCGSRQDEQKTSGTQHAVEKIANPFYGTWVRQKFIDTLKETQSPRASQGKELFYRMPQFLGDTGLLLVYHEGVSDYVVVRHDRSYFLKGFSGDSMEITRLDAQRIKIGYEIFTRTSDSQEIQLAEQVLFKGEYLLGGRTVSFSETGIITGLDTFQFYHVLFDYFDVGLDFDMIELGKTKDECIRYAFEFIEDTLLIYGVKGSMLCEAGEAVESEKDELKYKLIRKK